MINIRHQKIFQKTDESLEFYAKMHEPKFSDYYRPSNNQKMGEMVYVGGGMLALGYTASKFF